MKKWVASEGRATKGGRPGDGGLREVRTGGLPGLFEWLGYLVLRVLTGKLKADNARQERLVVAGTLTFFAAFHFVVPVGLTLVYIHGGEGFLSSDSIYYSVWVVAAGACTMPFVLFSGILFARFLNWLGS